jgi:hypothetical protein
MGMLTIGVLRLLVNLSDDYKLHSMKDIIVQICLSKSRKFLRLFIRWMVSHLPALCQLQRLFVDFGY